jgi:hypothetical protein
MAPETQAPVLDLVEWVAARPRPYAEVMEAWRTSCPRLTVWEDASTRGWWSASTARGDLRARHTVRARPPEGATQSALGRVWPNAARSATPAPGARHG